MIQPLEQQRIEYINRSGKFLAFPIAGAIVWLVMGLASLWLSSTMGVIVLMFGSGLIFPLALLIAKITKQDIFMKGNRFGSLMGQSVLMVNLLWALHFLVADYAVNLVPVSLAISLGIHWIVFGWIIQSPIGRTHAITRTFLVVVAFKCFSNVSTLAVSIAVFLCYIVTIIQLSAFFKNWDS